MPETPEQKARREIDANLRAAGWLVQARDELDLTAGRGIAVCEFPLQAGFGFADYLLYLDRKAVGAVEAVADNGNVDFEVYRIRTRITEQGSTIAVGDAG